MINRTPGAHRDDVQKRPAPVGVKFNCRGCVYIYEKATGMIHGHSQAFHVAHADDDMRKIIIDNIGADRHTAIRVCR